ncbi:MAG TPA: HAD family hydrolase [Tepidisphaeraceae bacterium]|jgi:putative hydrolase of the HAD superfamily
MTQIEDRGSRNEDVLTARAIRAVLFDFGDTLLDFEPMDTRAVFREAARVTYDHLAGLGARLPAFERYARGHFRAVRWAYFWAKLRRREFSSFELLRRFHQRMGLPTEDGLLRDLAWMWYEPLTRHTRVEDGLLAALATMREAGLRLGVISNTFVPGFVHDRHLADVGLLEFFPVRVYSSETGYRKPDRRIFEAALGRLGVTARETLFVGDLIKTDIVGARRMGMRTALKQPFANLRPHRIADHVIRRISDLMPLLAINSTAVAEVGA